MLLGLHGRTVLLTGANGGIGCVTVQSFLDAGMMGRLVTSNIYNSINNSTKRK
jgi:NAD(P)-dependent dehydrogenase (short-subunit alcohol dehydrogenase family)